MSYERQSDLRIGTQPVEELDKELMMYRSLREKAEEFLSMHSAKE